MKNIILFFFLLTINVSNIMAQNIISKEEVISIMRKVCDYELANPNYADNWQRDILNGWIRATFYPGLLAMHRVSNDQKYINEAVDWGNTVKWMPAARFRHADDLICGASYIEMYEIFNEPKMLSGIQNRCDSIMEQPKPGREDWHWCDALFMAPQVYAKLGKITSEAKYHKYLHEQFFDAVDFLYDKEESLFYRDKNFFDRKSLNGKKIFWSRGNGWVFAGIPRIVDNLSEDDPYKEKYLTIFREMAEIIIVLQGEDGCWGASLLDSEEFPMKESSGTAMFCYGLAWGINNKVLDRDKYLPYLMKSWNGLLGVINEEGRLRFVQPGGNRPVQFPEDYTHCYAVGSFLLAGEQILKLDQN
jgi:rhamnogalacturonyl hydrolase YesR